MTIITRRRFLGRSIRIIEGSIAATVGLSVVPWRDALAQAALPDIVDVSGIQSGATPSAMVAAVLQQLGGMQSFVKRGDYVVIKPNAAFAAPPEWAVTTHPETVVAVARAALAAGAKRVTVVEFPQAKGMKCLERCGLAAALATVPDVQLKVLENADDFKTVTVKDGIALKSVDVAKLVLSADVLINIPAAKNHETTVVSFGLKNHMGLIRDRRVFHTQLDIHQAVADLGRVIKPQLTLVDATRVLLTGGPAGPGETQILGRMVAGRNVVSVDAYALTLAPYNRRPLGLRDAPHIYLAAQAGLGQTDLDKLRIAKVTV